MNLDQSLGACQFKMHYDGQWLAGMRKKLGLSRAEDGDYDLAQALLDIMASNAADFTLTFRRLCDATMSTQADEHLRSLFAEPAALDSWMTAWRLRLAREPLEAGDRALSMRQVSPVYIPRNHMVEHALTAAVQLSDHSAFDKLLVILSQPFQEQVGMDAYSVPPPHGPVFRTYCGT